MVITRLEMRRFKCFRQAVIDFTSGFNIIKGPNESGKSTLRTALMAALFGNPLSASETVKRWMTWGQPEACELILDYLDHNQRTCRLRKDFATHKMFLQCGEENFKIPKVIQQKVVEELGVPTEELYELCACLDVRSLSYFGNPANRKQVSKMLAGLISGTASGQDVLQVLKRLDEGLKELGKGLRYPSKIPGPLKSTQERFKVLSAQRHQMEQNVNSQQERLAKYEQLVGELKTVQSQQADVDHLLDANLKLHEAQKQKSALLAQEEQYEHARLLTQEQQKEIAALEERMQSDPLAGLTAADVEELRHLTTEKEKWEQKIQSASPRREDSSINLVLGLGVGLILLGGLSCFKQLILGGIILFAGLGLFIGAWKKHSEQRVRRQKSQAEYEQSQKALTEVDQRLSRWQAKLPRRLLPEEIFRAWPETQIRLVQHQALSQQQQAQSVLDPERGRLIRRELRLAEDVLNDPKLAALRLEPAELARYQREKQNLSERRQDLSQEIQRLRAILDYDPANPDALAELDENLAELEDRVSYLEEREKICRLTYDYLDQARRDTLHPARKVLEERAGELLAIFSQGHYRNIAVDDEDLSSKILIAETGQWEDLAVLSQGAFDQCYLSLRLALAEIFSQGKKPPLFLDDALSAFDQQRQKATLQYLQTVATMQQIFLFTCRSDYDAAANHVVDLTGREGKAELECDRGYSGQ